MKTGVNGEHGTGGGVGEAHSPIHAKPDGPEIIVLRLGCVRVALMLVCWCARRELGGRRAIIFRVGTTQYKRPPAGRLGDNLGAMVLFYQPVLR